MPTPRENTGEQYYNEVAKSIRSLFEMTTRVDERVQAMVKKQDELDRKIELQISHGNSLSNRVSLLESHNSREDIKAVCDGVEELKESVRKLDMQMRELEGESGRQKERWSGIFGFVIQLVWILLASYMLYRLGLQGPP